MTKIMVGDIVRALDGPLAPIRCAGCAAYRRCEVRLAMTEARAIAAVPDRKSVADMCETLAPVDLGRRPEPGAEGSKERNFSCERRNEFYYSTRQIDYRLERLPPAVDDASKREIDAMSGFSAIHPPQRRRDKHAALDAVLFLIATLTPADVAFTTRPHASRAAPATHELPSR